MVKKRFIHQLNLLLLSLIVNQINDQVFVVVENNEIAKKIFQDCQSF